VRIGHSELIQALAGRLTGERHGRLNADCEVSKINEIYLVRGPLDMVELPGVGVGGGRARLSKEKKNSKSNERSTWRKGTRVLVRPGGVKLVFSRRPRYRQDMACERRARRWWERAPRLWFQKRKINYGRSIHALNLVKSRVDPESALTIISTFFLSRTLYLFLVFLRLSICLPAFATQLR
jgi:hypothetical protein